MIEEMNNILKMLEGDENMISKLEELRDENKYISIYMNRNIPANFVYGRVLSVDEDYIVVYLIAPNGKYDGVLVKETCEIFRIEEECQYSERMQKLIDKEECDRFPFVLECHNVVNELIQIAKDTQKIISLELLNSEENDVVGFVENIDGDLCTIKQIDLYGQVDGYSYISMNDITQISYDSEDERILMQLCE